MIQEARVFNETPISPRKCRILLTKIVYLLYVGETFGTQEATTLFFGVTKLFQHKDVSRQVTASFRSECCWTSSPSRDLPIRLPRWGGRSAPACSVSILLPRRRGRADDDAQASKTRQLTSRSPLPPNLPVRPASNGLPRH